MLTTLLALSLAVSEPPLIQAEAPHWSATVQTSLWLGQNAFSSGISLERRLGSNLSLGTRVDFQAVRFSPAGAPTQESFRVDIAPLARWFIMGNAPSGVWIGIEAPMGFIAGEVRGFTVGGVGLLGYSFLFESGLTVQIAAGPSLRYFSQRGGGLALTALQAGVGGTLAFGYAW